MNGYIASLCHDSKGKEGSAEVNSDVCLPDVFENVDERNQYEVVSADPRGTYEPLGRIRAFTSRSLDECHQYAI